MTEHQIKFANEHIDPIVAGDKTTTAWLHIEWQDVTAGDTLLIQNEDGRHVATAMVDTAQTIGLQAALVALNNRKGHKSYASIHELQTALSEYYPEHDITLQTGIRIIDFHVVEAKESIGEKA